MNDTNLWAQIKLSLFGLLSPYWVQLAQQLPRNSRAEIGHKHLCPVCNSAPVSSVIHFGEAQGLRYLHCSLCESEWHVVRTKCTNCDETGKLDYWSLDTVEAAVKAESCGDCHSYLKVLYQDKDVNVEPVADDLATLFLDFEMEQRSFKKWDKSIFISSRVTHLQQKRSITLRFLLFNSYTILF